MRDARVRGVGGGASWVRDEVGSLIRRGEECWLRCGAMFVRRQVLSAGKIYQNGELGGELRKKY